jgi:hypothetical protein
MSPYEHINNKHEQDLTRPFYHVHFDSMNSTLTALCPSANMEIFLRSLQMQRFMYNWKILIVMFLLIIPISHGS